jgi:hypothetical protein
MMLSMPSTISMNVRVSKLTQAWVLEKTEKSNIGRGRTKRFEAKQHAALIFAAYTTAFFTDMKPVRPELALMLWQIFTVVFFGGLLWFAWRVFRRMRN